MKKSTLIALLLLISSKLFAFSDGGGQLRYEFNGTNYTIYLTLYGQCGGFIPTSSQTIFYESSCTGILSRSLSLTSSDTLKDMYCATASTGCGTGTYQYWIAQVFSDTVSLPSCSDWKIWFKATALSASITNMVSPGSSNLFLSAGLNNSTAMNNNALIDNLPPFYITKGINTTVPINTADFDADSVVINMMQPMNDTASVISYYTGYSLSTPLGSGSSTTITQYGGYPEWLNIVASNGISQDLLAMKISEYRAGVLVGYSTREWVSQILAISLPKAPYVYTYYQYPAVPGMADSLQVSFLDSTTSDSIFVDFQPTNGWSYTTSTAPSTGYASGKIKWTTPSAVDPATYPYFYINVRAYDHSCPYTGESWFTFAIPVAYPNDSVWPGDANGDKTVNIYDPLAVAVAYGKTGATRTGASTSWVAQYCAAWSTSFVSGINMNKADCNGDGTVNSTDLGAITANYGNTHPRGSWNNGARTTGVPDLYFDMTGVTLTPGANVTIPIKLGTSSLSVSKIYGLAGSAVISGITPTADPTFTTPATTFMGTSSTTLSFNKAVNPNKVDFAYAKTDHLNASGNGTIANISFTVPASAANGTQVVLSFAGLKFIDSAGKPLTSFNVLSDTSAVTTAVPNVNTALVSAIILPNPSTNYVNIKLNLEKDADLQIQITDIVGKTVWQQSGNFKSGNQLIPVPAGNIPAGMYMLHISGEGWQYPVIKWVKE
jgi:hypothetical protein